MYDQKPARSRESMLVDMRTKVSFNRTKSHKRKQQCVVEERKFLSKLKLFRDEASESWTLEADPCVKI